MLNRYSKIALNSSSDSPMNSKPPRNSPKRPDPEDDAADQDHREPQPRARQERADGVARQAPAQVPERPGRLLGGDRRQGEPVAVSGIARLMVAIPAGRDSRRDRSAVASCRPMVAGQLEEQVFERPVVLHLRRGAARACPRPASGRGRRCRSGRPAPRRSPAGGSTSARRSPDRACATNRSLTIRALRGSSPTRGSSTTRTLGSCTSAEAKTTRCFIPCE